MDDPADFGVSHDLAVIGLGYVGLQLARAASRSGLAVVGLDIDTAAVVDLNAGRSCVGSVSDGDVRDMNTAGFRASVDEDVLAGAAVIAICVPTPLSIDDEPDLGPVQAATEAIERHLREEQIVVLESTTYPGTTDEVVRPILEKNGLKAGVDFHLAYSPERVDPGNPDYGIANTPKVVGGHTSRCTELAAAFYRRFVDTVVECSGTREAEMTKLLENTYRHVNIALVNEMAQVCHEMDIDFWEVIRHASTKPFGFQAFHPGPGVGGHCIPIDPTYLTYKVRSLLGQPLQLVEIAETINRHMPAYIVTRVTSLLNLDSKPLHGSRILLLGVTYKRDVGDQRGSPAPVLAELLIEAGADVSFHDPYVSTWIVDGRELPRADELEPALSAADVTILLQDHREYELDVVESHARRLFDTRGVTRDPRIARL